MERNAQQPATGLAATLRASFPRQHGAWSALLAAYALGTLIAGRFSVESLFLLLAITAAFCGREAFVFLLRLPAADPHRSSGILLTALWALLFTTGALPLALECKGKGLLTLGAIAGAGLGVSIVTARRKKDEMSFGGEILGMASLSLIAPVAQHVAAGGFSQTTLGLWLLCLLFLLGSVFHVRFVVRHRKERAGSWKDRLKAGIPSLVFHLMALGVVIAISRYTPFLPVLAPIALVPVIVKVGFSLARKGTATVQIRRIGLLELAHTAAFVVLSVFAFQQAAFAAI